MPQISKHFSFHEALWCPQWNREADESDDNSLSFEDVTKNLVLLFERMDKIREFFDKPINVHCCYRPKDYNKLVGGASHSSHCLGEAIDFDVQGMTCDEVRQAILDNKLLESLGMRMENKPHSLWVHLDIHPVPPNGHRFFLP